MIKILHAADLHLDSAFEALSDDKAAMRRREQRELLSKIARLAESESVDLVLLAGDLLDSDTAYMETGEMLRQTLGSLSIPVFIAPGNHDFWSSRSPYAKIKMPKNVHIFSSESIECVELSDIGARVWGAAFEGISCSPLLSGFKAQKVEGLVDIMIMHGQVGAKSGVYNPITEDELAASGMDYVALGHVHTFSGLQRAGNTWYAWPGCAEGRGFDELGDKGVIIASVSHSDCDLTFVPISGRKYEITQVNITNFDSIPEAVEGALPDSTEKDIYRIILTGEHYDAPDLKELYQKFSCRFFEVQFKDKTVLRRDIWEKSGEDTLRGLFLAKLRRQYEAAADETEGDRIVQAARWGLQALDQGEELHTI